MFTIPQYTTLSISGVKARALGHTTGREVSPLPTISYDDRNRERGAAEREAAEREKERENQRVREFFNIIT